MDFIASQLQAQTEVNKLKVNKNNKLEVQVIDNKVMVKIDLKENKEIKLMTIQ